MGICKRRLDKKTKIFIWSRITEEITEESASDFLGGEDMRIDMPIDKVYHLIFETKKELVATFLRFQEHYESPEFRGKVFTLKEFREWYIKNSENGKKTGRFTYYSDWDGFNIPSSILKPFYEGRFDPLSRREKILLDEFQAMKDTRFYLIGSSGDKAHGALNHEIAHGLYYTNDEYHASIDGILKAIPKKTRKKIQKFFHDMGYHEGSADDEMHAVLLEYDDYFEDAGITDKSIPIAHERIKKLFTGYFGPEVQERYLSQISKNAH